ncbi:MAG: DUF4249 domain-containing protein [Chitinophagaceae bacterium]|nr:DUF4249 domain-containing protein [Chitinophagaceae bacterium]
MIKKLTILILLAIVVNACREKYVAQTVSTGKGLLVVEGFINIGSQVTTTIVLSRTTDLPDPVNRYEGKAKVNIQSESGSVYPLTEGVTGTYISAALTLPANTRYRLQIVTSVGKEYLSDYASPKATPDISGLIVQKRADLGVDLYTKAKLNASDSKYYQWKIEETWQFMMPFDTYFNFAYNPAGGLVSVSPMPGGALNTAVKTCWHTDLGSTIQLTNLEKFTSDSVVERMVNIPANSQKLSIKYSINIKEYAISRDAYLFLEAMKKNTEQLGSIFDAQPSDLRGNIHCTNAPDEQVIGYVDATQEKTKRFFVVPSDIQGGWPYDPGCKEMQVDSIQGLASYVGYLPTHYLNGGPLQGFFAPSTCVNCLLTGTNQKPSFWP